MGQNLRVSRMKRPKNYIAQVRAQALLKALQALLAEDHFERAVSNAFPEIVNLDGSRHKP